MTWEETVREYMNREENEDGGNEDEGNDNNMTDTNERVIEQRCENGVDEIKVDDLRGKSVSENCCVCWRSLPDDGERSELFHITALMSQFVRDDRVLTKSFCGHCAPPHAIDVEVMVKAMGSTPRDAYTYHEIVNVFLHDSELEALK